MDFLTLFISLRCTNSCSHCLYGCSPSHGEDMSLDVFRRSLALASKNNINKINFFGGEPLVNLDFFSMVQITLESGFSLILATNCYPLSDGKVLNNFLNITKQYKERIEIVTARDRFHLQYFDPADIIIRLKNEGYSIVVNNYADYSILISEYNIHNQELAKLDTCFSCCADKWSDALGVLPNGGWTICPTSLEPFGDIFSYDLSQIVQFKRRLPLRFKEGCTVCLKDFKRFRREFENTMPTGNRDSLSENINRNILG